MIPKRHGSPFNKLLKWKTNQLCGRNRFKENWSDLTLIDLIQYNLTEANNDVQLLKVSCTSASFLHRHHHRELCHSSSSRQTQSCISKPHQKVLSVMHWIGNWIERRMSKVRWLMVLVFVSVGCSSSIVTHHSARESTLECKHQGRDRMQKSQCEEKNKLNRRVQGDEDWWANYVR